MRTATLRLEDMKTTIINMGYVGENEHKQIRFDGKKMFQEYPNASVSLTVCPACGDAYPATIERDGDFVLWTITDSDLVAEGCGEIQLTFTESPHIAKSYICRTKVLRSLVPTGDIPSGLDDFITRADALLEELEDAIPEGGTTGQVLAKKSNDDFDTEWVDQTGGGGTGDYTDLTNKPQIGGVTLTGNKTLHDLGAATEEAVGAKYTKPSGGIPASDIASGVIPVLTDLIDDTAGDGDTDKVWSADKSADTVQSVLSEISQVTSATASDVGKAHSPKTVINGHVTEWEYVDTPIGVKSVTPAKTTFVEEHKGDNLFNPDTMLEVGKCVVSNNGKAELGSNQYTTQYGAIVVPVDGLTAVSIKQASSQTQLFNYFYTDSEDTIIANAQPKEAINNGYTITLNGTGTKLWLSIKNFTYAQDIGIMIVSGSTAKNYEPYYYYLSIPNLQNNSSGVLKCPAEYYAVVGDTLQIFYRGIINAVYDDTYDVVVRCDIGQAYERYYEVTPVAGNVGTHTLNVKVYTPDHSAVVAFADISLKVVAKMSSPGTEKVVLYVGDSLAENGTAPHEFHRRLTGSNGTPSGDQMTNITFIGSMTKDGTNYEGNGGWTFNRYNSESKNDANMLITCANHGKTQSDQHSVYKDSNNKEWKLETINTGTIKIIRVSASGTLPATGTLTWVSGGDNHDAITYTASEQASGNPFWDSTQQKVDFGTYATRMGESSIDYVYVLLGWNGGSLVESTYKDTVNTFIMNVHTSFPNAKIILMGLEIPAREGLAKNYLANNTSSMYYEMMQRVFSLNKWYKEIADATENVYFLNIAGQFDSKNNMQTASRQVNTRNATTETYQSNGVHPAESGYYQIADACYRHFNWLNS